MCAVPTYFFLSTNPRFLHEFPRETAPSCRKALKGSHPLLPMLPETVRVDPSLASVHPLRLPETSLGDGGENLYHLIGAWEWMGMDGIGMMNQNGSDHSLPVQQATELKM